MKKTSLLFGAILGCMLYTSCSDEGGKDDVNGDDPKIIKEAPLATEETPLKIEQLEKGISIDGATVKSGTISPTSNITFDVVDKEQSGFLDTGFNIELNVPDNYGGAILQILDESGNPSENYYDIPSDFKFSSSFKKRRKKHHKVSAKSLNDNNDSSLTIEVGFDETIPPGRFCYWICPYDADGNIGEPVEVCVEIESWGGNDNIAGTWNYTKEEEVVNGVLEVIDAGEADCTTSFTFCDSSEDEYEDCDTINSLSLTFLSNGAFTVNLNRTSTDIDFDDCQIKDFNSVSISKGNWAYNEEEGLITLVTNEYSETIDGEPVTDEYAIDDELGVGIELKLAVSGNNLEFSYNDTFSTGLDEQIEESVTIFFKK